MLVFFSVDIDECTTFHNLCVNGVCENMVGEFRCNCNQGFRLDESGGNCTGKSFSLEILPVTIGERRSHLI